jgi:hypothetical protein
MSAERETQQTTAAEPAADQTAEGAQEQRSPDEIRAEIESTREELGDTVEALAGKADVKGQARQRVEEVKDNVQAKREEFTAKVGSATPDGARQGGQQVVARIRENPLPALVAGAIVTGFLLGRLTSDR